MKIEQLLDASLLPEGTVQNGICIPYGTIPLWFLNDELEEAELERQIADFAAKGISGVMLHPRCYIPKSLEYMSPRYLALCKFAVECAEKHKMKIVLYDEAMYPSGSAHGAVVAENVDFSARGLGFIPLDEYVPKDTDVIVSYFDKGLKPCGDTDARYILTERYSGGTARGIHEGEDDGQPFAPKSSDLLNPEAVKCFIRHTHEKYYSVLKEYFGNTIIAFFTDEPSIMGRCGPNGLIPWGKNFIDYYIANGGTLEELPILFFKDNAAYKETCKKYKRIVNKRLSESFFGQLSDWCVNHKIVLCGHPESSMDIQALSDFGIPGQDMVWRYASPEKPLDGVHSTMGKCSSDAARHRGLKRNLNECLGCCSRTGNRWDLPCSDMKWYFDWMFARGVNMLMVHAFFYSTTGKRSGERPPDVGPNSAWWEHYNLFSDYIKRYSYVLSESTNLTDIAVLCTGDFLPHEKINAFYEKQVEFNYLEEDILNNCAVIENNTIIVQNQKYTRLVIEDISIFKDETVQKIKELEANGFKIIYADNDTAERLCDNLISPTNKNVRAERISKDGRNIVLLFNEGNEKVEFEVNFENAFMYFPFENEIYAFNGKVVLGVRQSVMLIEKQIGDCEYPIYSPKMPKYTEIIDISDKFVSEPLGDFSARKKGFFGKTEYTAEFELNDAGDVWLDLGEVCEICDLCLNGKYVGVKLWAPYTFDISKFVKKGTNTLGITVTNPAANKYDKDGAKSGLCGPIRILK